MPLTLSHQGRTVEYFPLVVKVGKKVHLLGLHQDGDWLVSHPGTGEVLMEVSAYRNRRPYSSAHLNLIKARIYAKKDLERLILAMGEEHFNEYLASPPRHS